MRLCPIDGTDQPICQQRDVEPELGGSRVSQLFFLRQQIEQQCRKSILLQYVGDTTIPGTVPAATAAVCEHHQPGRIGRKSQIGVERLARNIQSNRTRRSSFGGLTHASPLTMRYVGEIALASRGPEFAREDDYADVVRRDGDSK